MKEKLPFMGNNLDQLNIKADLLQTHGHKF